MNTYSLAFLRGFNEDGTFERLVCYLMNPCKPPAILPETGWQEIKQTMVHPPPSRLRLLRNDNICDLGKSQRFLSTSVVF